MRSQFQVFVAIRYLMSDRRHASWLAFGIGLFFALGAVAVRLVAHYVIGQPEVEPGEPTAQTYANLRGGAAVAIGCAALALYCFVVRWFFSFYTSVSIIGFSIGGAALVTVLSVMNGFEGHLRQKILGSNAHIQIGKEDGEFTEWEEIRDRVGRVRGVVASTPFATSEVVIAANNNYSNVIIKGIDVASAVRVTDLERNLVESDGLTKLEPLIDDPELPAPAPVPSPAPGEPVLDPAPDDLEDGNDPIDYSGSDEAAAPAGPMPGGPLPGGRLPGGPLPGGPLPGGPLPGGAAARDDGLTPQLAGPPDLDDLDDLGAGRLAAAADRDDERDRDAGLERDAAPDRPPLVPMPDDVRPDALDRDLPGRDLPPRRSAAGTSRIATLPGVLVGRELVKNIHLYPGQEVRLVSPLADPMNPDASGTPIPFNRDYRVAGEFYTGMYEYDLKLVYVTLDSLQRFLRLGDAVDGLEVRITDPDAVDSVVPAIARELGPGYRVQGWRELNRQLFAALKLEKIAMFIVLAIIILVASFSIVGTLIMIVVEKGRQIALFKTLGASDVEVVMLFIIQGTLIGLVGSALGVGIGLGLCFYLSTQGFPINPDVYYISRLPVDVDYPTVALVFLAGVLISIAATIYPSILAAQLRPAVGLKKA